MDEPKCRTQAAIIVLSLLSPCLYGAENLYVKVLDRRDSETSYSYVVPGWVNTTSNANANCTSTANTTNCAGATTTTGTVTPARSGNFQAAGATLSLQLPDGRIAVVNCNSTYQFVSGPAHRRSCRVPLVNNIWAEFDGDKAKLRWPVSLDGKKFDSETYKILAVQ